MRLRVFLMLLASLAFSGACGDTGGSDGDADIDSDADNEPDGDADADTDSDADGDGDTDSDGDGDGGRDADIEREPDAQTDSDVVTPPECVGTCVLVNADAVLKEIDSRLLGHGMFSAFQWYTWDERTESTRTEAL